MSLGPDIVFESFNGSHAPILSSNSNSQLEESSFSHLHIGCDNQNTPDYLMHATLPPATRRVITDAEKNILCTLGYTLNVCGCSVAGAIDFGPNCNETYEVSLCEQLIINEIDILGNDNLNIDLNDAEIGFIQVSNPAFGELEDNMDGTYTFTPTMIGMAVLTYVPIGCNGQ